MTVTEGILTKVSFGVSLPDHETATVGAPLMAPVSSGAINRAPTDKDPPFLQVSISQDPVRLEPKLALSAERRADTIHFRIDCNYMHFIKEAQIRLYDEDLSEIKTLHLHPPLPYQYEVAINYIFPNSNANTTLHYQLSVYDKDGREDRTGIGRLEL